MTLTIDERIQYVAERELKKAVEMNHCKTGSIVVMNPKTGEILAMTSYPTFNPNDRPEEGENLSSRLEPRGVRSVRARLGVQGHHRSRPASRRRTLRRTRSSPAAMAA